MGDGRGSELMDIRIERAASHLREVNLAALLWQLPAECT